MWSIVGGRRSDRAGDEPPITAARPRQNLEADHYNTGTKEKVSQTKLIHPYCTEYMLYCLPSVYPQAKRLPGPLQGSRFGF